MTSRGTVYDLGYTPHQGPRLGTGAAIRATIKDGLRRIFGIRRKARKKILPWLLVGIAIIPAVVFVGLAFFLATFVPEADTPFSGHPDYYDLAGPVMVLFTALAAPELLIPDREQGVLAVYSSRPMRAVDYLLAKGAALGIAIGFFLLLPQLLMYIGFAAISSDGFASGLIDGIDDLWRVLVTSFAFLVGYGAPALGIATYAKRLAPATGTLLGVLVGSTGLAATVATQGSFTGARYGALLALIQHPFVIRDWVFSQPPAESVPGRAGFGPVASLTVIAVIAVVTVALAVRRYRKLM